MSKIFSAGAILVTLLIFSFWLSSYVASNGTAQELLQQYGYFAVVALAFIGGLNLFVPIPAVSFIPIFLAAEIPPLGIIIAMAIGTTISDVVGYYIGLFGKTYAEGKQSRFHDWSCKICEKYEKWIVPIIFFYATLIPYPNELLIIPLAFMGVRLRFIILPLIAGTLIYHTGAVYGIGAIYKVVF